MVMCSLFVVEKNGHYCSLLGVTDRNRSTTSVTKLLQALEIKRVVSVASFNQLILYAVPSQVYYSKLKILLSLLHFRNQIQIFLPYVILTPL